MELEVGVEQTLNIGERSPGGPAWVKATANVPIAASVVNGLYGDLAIFCDANGMGEPGSESIQTYIFDGGVDADLAVMLDGGGENVAFFFWGTNVTPSQFNGWYWGFNHSVYFSWPLQFRVPFVYRCTVSEGYPRVIDNASLHMTDVEFSNALYPLCVSKYANGRYRVYAPDGTLAWESEPGLIFTSPSYSASTDGSWMPSPDSDGKLVFRAASDLLWSYNGEILGVFDPSTLLSITSIS